MKRQKTVEAYTCDCCGAEIDDRAEASVTVRCNGDIYYEWWANSLTSGTATRPWRSAAWCRFRSAISRNLLRT